MYMYYVIDMYINRGNMSVINMLNTKYIITTDQSQQPFVQLLYLAGH